MTGRIAPVMRQHWSPISSMMAQFRASSANGGIILLTITMDCFVPRSLPSSILALALLATGGCERSLSKEGANKPGTSATAGSSQCRTCHPAFYKKWATSHHGLAMQPFTARFAATLAPQDAPVAIEGVSYKFVLAGENGFVEESGPNGVRRLAIQHALGGKNTYYFLTPLERGRLQVLPIAYDVGKKSWYDMAASGVRMHVDRPAERPLAWTDPAFTFNTSCYSCHVSQLRTNYDLKSDTYHSVWSEPGINCETCHGSGDAHIALYKKDLNAKHADMQILRVTQFTVQQRSEMCAGCHAKMSPVSSSYQVTQRFFDHYDLVTLEDADYYPDGRDLGENYTYTSWLMSRCLRGGKLDCVYCHTSSGRYRFATGESEWRLPALSSGEGGERGGAHPSQGGHPGRQLHRLSHAENALREHESQRPLNATANAGLHD